MAAERQGGGGGGRGTAAEENKDHKDGKDNKENERPAGPEPGGLGDSLGLESILRSGGGGTWQARPRGWRGDVAAARGSQGPGGHGRRAAGTYPAPASGPVQRHPGDAGGAGLGLREGLVWMKRVSLAFLIYGIAIYLCYVSFRTAWQLASVSQRSCVLGCVL